MCLCVYPSHSSLNRKRRRNEKLLPPLLSPLSDEPPRKRTCDNGTSLNQEGGDTGTLPCSASSASSSSSHRHRRGEAKVSSHVTRNGSVSVRHLISLIGFCCEREKITFFILFYLSSNSIIISYINHIKVKRKYKNTLVESTLKICKKTYILPSFSDYSE